MEPFEYLKQNSNDMATVVETYLIEETVSLIYDGEKLEKWNSLVKELGLEGQDSICKPEKSPIPFQPMNEQLKSTFEVLCPAKVDISKYGLSPIPVEILDLCALSVKEGYFQKIQIWYDEKQKDPVCVGSISEWAVCKPDGGFLITDFWSKTEAEKYILDNSLEKHTAYELTWMTKNWILGRWADVKKSFAELKVMAKERFMFEQKTAILTEIQNKQRELEDLELTANTKFGI